MALTLFFDHDVPKLISTILRSRGMRIVTAFELRRHEAGDEEHLLFAARHGYVVVTRNARDFLLLHRAWLLWFVDFGVTPVPSHAGILVIPQDIGALFPSTALAYAAAANAIASFTQQTVLAQLANHLYLWDAASGGWKTAP